jgi:hypothetical protein
MSTKLRISGAIILLHLYAFMAQKSTTLPFSQYEYDRALLFEWKRDLGYKLWYTN